ncbi:MAG: pyruvate kinase [Candidatus Omnitrophota bacterium]
MPKTKIICTLGPASESMTVIRKMMLAGMDVVRLNFSHGDWGEHLNRLKKVRLLNQHYRRHIRILQDLEGYRIRIGKLKNGRPIELRKRQIVYLTQEDIKGDDKSIPLDYNGSLHPIKSGQLVFVDDGNIVLKVKAKESKRLKLEVIVGGWVKENKGLNMPGVQLSFSRITPKDKQDLRFAIENKVDYIAQSFVCSAKDVIIVRNLVKEKLPDCKIIAKIENRRGIKNIDQIIDVADGIIIARGDMGVSLPIYQLPIIQKQIIKKCNQKKKFVVTATQMLENMVENVRPTRAEVTDIANAILDGTNYLMLSAETAVGQHPSKAVKTMNDIIKYTEDSHFYNNRA